MKEQRMRTWAEIDLDAVAHNFNLVKNAAKTRVCCVIKADAYGHGAVMLAKKYQQLGADFFAVSNIEEAIQLRNADITLPILILGYTPAANAKELAEMNISQCLYSLEYARELSSEAQKAGVTVKVHVKIDTGMSRLGFFCQDIERDYSVSDEIYEAVNLPNIKAEGIFTHFAVSDESADGKEFTLSQLRNFTELIDDLEYNGVTFEYHHCANSAAIEDYADAHLDMVRAGIILYGLEPSSKVENKLDLQPVMTLKSVVSHIKTIPSGATVSYGRTFTADKDIHVATVAIGYADGFIRKFRDSYAIIKGKKCPIIGRVCMDQLMVDIGDLNDISIGEVVTLIGKDGNECVTADDLANMAETINYEVVCGVAARVPRIYLENGKEIFVRDYICPEE